MAESQEVPRPLGPALVCAVIALALALCWLALNVYLNHSGEWSGLFYTGQKMPLPAELAGGHTWRVQDPRGYDAAYYHIVAHDPLLRRDFFQFADNASLRWRRIAVPGLAALLSGGSDSAVDYAYVAIQLAFVFLGTFWLTRYAMERKYPPAWGLAFLLIPAVAVSLDRMTIDLPLAALTIALILYDSEGRPRWPVYAILAAAPLVRETGMLLVIAWCLRSLLRRDWKALDLGALCALPALGWWSYVNGRTPPDGTPWLSHYPFAGILRQTLHGPGIPLSSWWLRAAAGFEYLALAGIWLALGCAAYFVWRRRWGLVELTAIAFVVFAAFLGKLDIWADAYAAGRTMSPLLIVLALYGMRERKPVFAVPLLLILPRIALQYEAQIRMMLGGRS